MRNLIIALPIIFIFIAQSAFGQTGKITGKVISSKTGEPLIGASISIEGSSHSVTSDLNGVYTISGLNPGNYSVICSYVSYAKKVISDIAVKSGESAPVNISLDQTTAAVEGVVVRSRVNREN